MIVIAEIMNLCKKEIKTCMQCRVTSSAMLSLCSTTKGEWVMEILEVKEEEEQ